MFSWTDRYLTIYAGEYTFNSQTVDNFGEVITNRDHAGFISSKVIDVRYQSRELSSIQICIMQNTRDIDHWFWIECKYIKEVNSFAQAYRRAEEELKKNKMALLILLDSYRHNDGIKAHLKFDQFDVYKFHSMDELKKLLHLPIEYQYMAEENPQVISYRELVTEAELEELYFELERKN